MTPAGIEPLRLGVVGCGRVFERFHLPAILRVANVDLVAASDTDQRRRTWAKRQLPRAAIFDSADKLLTSADLEAILVLTPPSTHAGFVIGALDRGLHVLVEKPMALTFPDGRRMVQAAKLSQRRLQVGFSRRFREPYRRLRLLLQNLDGKQLRAIRFELSFPAASWSSRSDFLGDEAQGGGVLDDVLCHQVDLLCWLLDRRPDEARASSGQGPGDSLAVEVRFGEVAAHLTAAHGRYAERLEIELADGSMLEASGSGVRTGIRSSEWRRRRALLLDRFALVADRLLRRPNVSLTSFERQLRDFERAVRGAESEGATADDGLLAIEIVQACRASARQEGAWQAVGIGVKPAG